MPSSNQIVPSPRCRFRIAYPGIPLGWPPQSQALSFLPLTCARIRLHRCLAPDPIETRVASLSGVHSRG